MKALLALVLAAALGHLPQDAKAVPAKPAAPTAEDQAKAAAQVPSYPLVTCIVSDEDLGDKPIDILHDGKLVRLCCKGCRKEFEKDPAAIHAKIDAAVIAQQTPDYPLATCAVSGEPLGGMGTPLDVVHGTRLVRLCCKGCVKGFQKDPGAFLAKVDAALIEAQAKAYPLDTCVVSGDKLGSHGKPIDYLYGTRLVRFCSKGCVDGFLKEPAAHLAKISKQSEKSM